MLPLKARPRPKTTRVVILAEGPQASTKDHASLVGLPFLATSFRSILSDELPVLRGSFGFVLTGRVISRRLRAVSYSWLHAVHRGACGFHPAHRLAAHEGRCLSCAGPSKRAAVRVGDLPESEGGGSLGRIH